MRLFYICYKKKVRQCLTNCGLFAHFMYFASASAMLRASLRKPLSHSVYSLHSANIVFPKHIRLASKAVLIDHISPGRLQFTYIAKQQILNSGFWWSILSGQLLSRPLAFIVNHSFNLFY